MKLFMLALWDVKVDAYMTPFFAQSVGAATRSLADLVNGNGEDPPRRHPEDFSLHLFGTWDTDGYFELLKQPQRVCEAANLKTAGE